MQVHVSGMFVLMYWIITPTKRPKQSGSALLFCGFIPHPGLGFDSRFDTLGRENYTYLLHSTDNYEDSSSESIKEKYTFGRICTSQFSGRQIYVNTLLDCVMFHCKSADYSLTCTGSFDNLLRSTGFYLVIRILVSGMSFAQ